MILIVQFKINSLTGINKDLNRRYLIINKIKYSQINKNKYSTTIIKILKVYTTRSFYDKILTIIADLRNFQNTTEVFFTRTNHKNNKADSNFQSAIFTKFPRVFSTMELKT